MRQVCITALGQVDFVTDPRGTALLRVASLEVVGRADILRRWREFLSGAPAQPVLFRPGLGLDPDLTQRLYSRNAA
jgi:hypothetical protein